MRKRSDSDSSDSDLQHALKSPKLRSVGADSLIQTLADVLSLDSTDPDLFDHILSKVSDLSRSSARKSASRDGFLQQELEIKSRRIQDLETMLKDSQRLCQDTEAKLGDKSANTQELLRQIDEQQHQIESLESALRRFLVACEVYEPEAALAEVQRLKREHREHEKYSQIDIESRFAKLIAARREGFDAICQQIDEQGKAVQADLHSLGDLIAADDDERLPGEIARTLESTNRLLEERMDQLRAARIYESDESDDEVPNRKQRSRGRKTDEALGPSLWMAKTRDVLALERQIHRVNRKLDHAVGSCHFLAQENTRLHASLEEKPASLPETLL
jgi:hypothetical protein